MDETLETAIPIMNWPPAALCGRSRRLGWKGAGLGRNERRGTWKH